MGRFFRMTQTDGSLAVTAAKPGARALVARPMLLKAALVVTGVGVLTASAWISVPFYPVPITMQTLAVFLIGAFLGPRLGVASVTSYVALGLAGAPVFQGGRGGALALAGPTGGYLAGFVLAAFVMGVAARGVRTRPVGDAGALSRLAALVVGAVLAEVAIYTLGLSWLTLAYVNDAGTAIAVGLVPFILGDLLKIAIAVTVAYGGKNLLARWGSSPF